MSSRNPLPVPLSRRTDTHPDCTGSLAYICTGELNGISAGARAWFWSQGKNPGETWELEMAKEPLWSAVWPQLCPPKDAMAGCGWVCASWSRYPGVFLGMFNLLVEMWPQFPLQKHQCVSVPQRGPQTFGFWAPFWVDRWRLMAAAWRGKLNLSPLAAPHQLGIGEE